MRKSVPEGDETAFDSRTAEFVVLPGGLLMCDGKPKVFGVSNQQPSEEGHRGDLKSAFVTLRMDGL